jgi:transposase
MLDARKLLGMLVRHHRGEKVWSVMRGPTVADEDRRRQHRELDRLKGERTAHGNCPATEPPFPAASPGRA